MKPTYKTIDMQSWPRSQSFQYYTQMAPTTYSVSINMDVTILRNTLKEKHFKFFPAYLYLVTKEIGNIQELRTASKNQEIGYWDYLTPAYPQFHEDDKTTSLLWTEYNPDFKKFYAKYIEDTNQFGGDHGIITSKGIPPENTYIISCIPWFTFNSFSLHTHGIKDYYFPSFEAGKFFEHNKSLYMPLSITVHHATTDGYHLKEFFENLQSTMNNPNSWL